MSNENIENVPRVPARTSFRQKVVRPKEFDESINLTGDGVILVTVSGLDEKMSKALHWQVKVSVPNLNAGDISNKVNSFVADLGSAAGCEIKPSNANDVDLHTLVATAATPSGEKISDLDPERAFLLRLLSTGSPKTENLPKRAQSEKRFSRMSGKERERDELMVDAHAAYLRIMAREGLPGLHGQASRAHSTGSLLSTSSDDFSMDSVPDVVRSTSNFSEPEIETLASKGSMLPTVTSKNNLGTKDNASRVSFAGPTVVNFNSSASFESSTSSSSASYTNERSQSFVDNRKSATTPKKRQSEGMWNFVTRRLFGSMKRMSQPAPVRDAADN